MRKAKLFDKFRHHARSWRRIIFQPFRPIIPRGKEIDMFDKQFLPSSGSRENDRTRLGPVLKLSFALLAAAALAACGGGGSGEGPAFIGNPTPPVVNPPTGGGTTPPGGGTTPPGGGTTTPPGGGTTNPPGGGTTPPIATGQAALQGILAAPVAAQSNSTSATVTVVVTGAPVEGLTVTVGDSAPAPVPSAVGSHPITFTVTGFNEQAVRLSRNGAVLGQLSFTATCTPGLSVLAGFCREVLRYEDKVYAIWTFGWPHLVTLDGATPATNTTGRELLGFCALPVDRAEADGHVLLLCKDFAIVRWLVVKLNPLTNTVSEYDGPIRPELEWSATPDQLVVLLPENTKWSFVESSNNPNGWATFDTVADGVYFTPAFSVTQINFRNLNGVERVVATNPTPDRPGNGVNIIRAYTNQ